VHLGQGLEVVGFTSVFIRSYLTTSKNKCLFGIFFFKSVSFLYYLRILIHRKSMHVRYELQRVLVALFSTIRKFSTRLFYVEFDEEPFLLLDISP